MASDIDSLNACLFIIFNALSMEAFNIATFLLPYLMLSIFKNSNLPLKSNPIFFNSTQDSISNTEPDGNIVNALYLTGLSMGFIILLFWLDSNQQPSP